MTHCIIDKALSYCPDSSKVLCEYVHGPVIPIRVPYSHNLYLNTDLNSKIVITSAVLSFRERALEKAE